MSPYSFHRLTVRDLPMLQRWAATPAVREWWTDADGQAAGPVDENDLDDPRVSLWIVHHQGEPFAYLQDYDPHAWDNHHFAHLPAGSRGIDQFIGVPEMIDRGHGSAFIRAHVENLISKGAPAIGTDPHPDNARAIRAYEKAGFVRGETCSTQWGLCLLMTRYA